jgi:hypothetical protein
LADARNWPIRKLCSKVQPPSLGLADADPALEIAVDAAEIAHQFGLLGLDPLDDAMEAHRVPLAPGQWRKGLRVGADPLPQLPDAVDTRDLPVQIAWPAGEIFTPEI